MTKLFAYKSICYAYQGLNYGLSKLLILKGLCIVAYLNKGDFFGEKGLFEEQDYRSAWVHSKTECEVAEISYVKFKEISKANPEFLFALSAQMACRLRNTTRKVCDLAFLDVTGRVARTLLELSKEPDAMMHPDGMQIKITRQEIGIIVSCTRKW